MRVITRFWVPALVVLLLPVLDARSEVQLVPLDHWVVEGEAGGSVLVFLRKGGDEEPLATVVALETTKGDRARLLAHFDKRSGIETQRIDDLSTGWYAERRLDVGVRNLPEQGSVGNGSTAEWFMYVQDLRRRESSGATYTLATTDAFATWYQPPGDETADSNARVKAMADFSAQLRDHPPPNSVLRSIRLLRALTAGALPGLSDFEGLISGLQDAFVVAKLDTPAAADEAEAKAKPQNVPLSEQRDMIDAVRRDLESYRVGGGGDEETPP